MTDPVQIMAKLREWADINGPEVEGAPPYYGQTDSDDVEEHPDAYTDSEEGKVTPPPLPEVLPDFYLNATERERKEREEAAKIPPPWVPREPENEEDWDRPPPPSEKYDSRVLMAGVDEYWRQLKKDPNRWNIHLRTNFTEEALAQGNSDDDHVDPVADYFKAKREREK